MEQIQVKAEPKPVKRRYQHKVVTQNDRARFTLKQNLDFITEFVRLKKEKSGLTQSAARATISDTQKHFPRPTPAPLSMSVKRGANNSPGPPPGPPSKRPRTRREYPH